ncbi:MULTISPECIES: zinc-dependent alcohol dehydrogenase family protein [unclassified Thauera]|uniref:zinc-dependent alcohol dehydrogenase family protein n=1 Tax=unclassified Thauera TaxID=2609274 RepID=UPI001E61E456|nr:MULTISPECIES: zinc-dependent alcohol dehydrogenase family protein [unclassified Thauera]WBL62506.1 zinc-dependent alcohol dehydrogenase family protein [Thauera sp. WB-2]HNR59570.1 zinc-dependent alcohol dehydrogenase family protein [Thauera sp.]
MPEFTYPENPAPEAPPPRPLVALPATMRAMVLERSGEPLRARALALPRPGHGQVLLRVEACGVCRTDLHLVDGELPDPLLPMIPGHEIVGRVAALGTGVSGLAPGQRIGVPWLGWTCGRCDFCTSARENLCDEARFTGYQIQGGYAEYTVADARYCFALDDALDAAEAAPLLCAGLIGYRALGLAGAAQRIGLYGFGAAAHIIAQVARWQGREVYAFTRVGDTASQAFAHHLGATWAGSATDKPPHPLDAALIFAPAGELVPAALRALAKGGTVVCAGIHMSDIPSFPYDILWGERRIVSVANLTRSDGDAFLALAPRVPVRTEITRFALEDANLALERLRRGELQGAAVLVP